MRWEVQNIPSKRVQDVLCVVRRVMSGIVMQLTPFVSMTLVEFSLRKKVVCNFSGRFDRHVLREMLLRTDLEVVSF